MISRINNAQIFSQGAFRLADIEVHAGRISAVLPPSDQVAGRPEELDLSGCFVIPGLIDAHAHLVLSHDAGRHDSLSSRILHGTSNARKHLVAGVTSVRDVGGPGNITVELARAIGLGLIPGPRTHTSGSFICATGGHVNYWAREADGGDEVIKAAREQFKAGASFIKIMASGGVADENENPEQPQYSFAELSAIVEEAERHGSYVAAHAHPASAIRDCLRAGVHSIEHASFMDDECNDLALQHDAVIVPTFSVYVRMANSEALSLKQRDLCARVLERKSELFLRAVAQGVNWGVGTDAGTFQPPGTLWEELAFLQELGIPAAQILDAATHGNARLLRESELGSIAAGQHADLVILDSDPLQDFSRLAQPKLVIQAGRIAMHNEADRGFPACEAVLSGGKS